MTTSLEAFTPIPRGRLSDELVQRIAGSISTGRYTTGDRLPTIAEMARGFRVGLATVREALTKLEAMRIVEIRHGSGVFVK